MILNKLFELKPYSLSFQKKTKYLNSILNELTKHHYNKCEKYRNILNTINFNTNLSVDYVNLPFLPVRLFKNHDLYSINNTQINKMMTSSGTGNQKVSRIFIYK